MDSALLGIDPLLFTYIKVFVKEILNLERITEYPVDLYKFCGHNIKCAEICGVIVAVETNSRMATYTVDDGTGTIPCNYWIKSYSFQPLKLGTIVRVLGKITTYNDMRQLMITDLNELNDPNQELLHFCQVISFKKQYEKPFEMPTRIENETEAIKKQFAQGNSQKLIPTDQNEQYSERAFEEILLEHIEKTQGNNLFSLSTPRDDPALIQHAIKVLQDTYNNTEPSEEDISRCFMIAFNDLIDTGSIVQINKQKQLFQVMDDKHLTELVLKIVKEMLDQLEDYYGGVRFEYILAKITEIPKYNALSKNNNKLKKVVNNLVKKGFLNPVNEKEYKIIF